MRALLSATLFFLAASPRAIAYENAPAVASDEDSSRPSPDLSVTRTTRPAWGETLRGGFNSEVGQVPVVHMVQPFDLRGTVTPDQVHGLHFNRSAGVIGSVNLLHYNKVDLRAFFGSYATSGNHNRNRATAVGATISTRF
jgi:hypothetical protein